MDVHERKRSRFAVFVSFTRFSIVASLDHLNFLKKTTRSWTYMRENLVDSPYLFLHCVFSTVASPTHP